MQECIETLKFHNCCYASVGDMVAGVVASIKAPKAQKDPLIAKLLNEIIPTGRQILEKFLTDQFFVGNEVRI